MFMCRKIALRYFLDDTRPLLDYTKFLPPYPPTDGHALTQKYHSYRYGGLVL